MQTFAWIVYEWKTMIAGDKLYVTAKSDKNTKLIELGTWQF